MRGYNMIKLIKGDCLQKTGEIPAGSVDLVLIDPPYGKVKGLRIRPEQKESRYDWDTAINPDSIHHLSFQLLRESGRLIAFAMEPYTSHMVIGALPDLPFSYKMIWKKDNFANKLSCNACPVNYYEEILMFKKDHDHELKNPLRPYFRKILEFIGKGYKEVNKDLGHRRAEHCLYVTRGKMIDDIGGKVDHCTRIGSSQFNLCTKSTYQELTERYKIDKMPGFMEYEELKKNNLKSESTFNLKSAEVYKSNIFEYPKPYDYHHPTQKPTLLLEDLIKTFSNPGDTVVDFAMGSGSAAIACINTDRNFIGIEKEKKYFDIAVMRAREIAPLFLPRGSIEVIE